jgi:3-phenylpropionate/trans-cinnamate dioxygenase ferredoxin subunit
VARHVVATLAELPPGSRRRVAVGGREIVLFNVAGEIFALADRCPHQGGRLSEGRLVGLVEAAEPGRYGWSRPDEIIRCPWHGWEFDLRTGQSRCEPARLRTRAYEVTLEPADPGPVETFPVTRDATRILVELPGV